MSLIAQSFSSIFYHTKQSLTLFVLFFFLVLTSISSVLFNQISIESFKTFKKMLLTINIDPKRHSNLISTLTSIHENQTNLIYPIIIGLSVTIIIIILIIYKKIIKIRSNEYLSLHHIGESYSKIALSFAFEILIIFVSAISLVIILIFLLRDTYASFLETINIYWLKQSLSAHLSSSEISSELLKLMSHKLTNFNGDLLISSVKTPFNILISQKSFVYSAYILIGGTAISFMSFLSVLFSIYNSKNTRSNSHERAKTRQ